MLTFYQYMNEAHKKEDSPAGDLLRDMESDRDFPRRAKGYWSIKRYLESKNAGAACMETFYECFEAYRNYREEDNL